MLAVLPDALKPAPYGWDQSYALQAASRLAAGKALTYSRAAFPDYVADDLARPRYVYYARYAPGYPVLIGALLMLGLSLPRVVIYTKLTAYVIGWIGLGLVAARVFRRWSPLLLYTMVAFPFLRPVPLSDATDVLLWAVIPFWTLALMRLFVHLQAREIGRVALWAFVAALLAFIGTAFRWAGVFLLPATGLLVILAACHCRRPLGGMLALLICLDVALLPTLSMKRHVESQPNAAATYFSEATPGWSPVGLCTQEPYLGLLARPFQLDGPLDRLGVPHAPLILSLLAVPVAIVMLSSLGAVVARTAPLTTPGTAFAAITTVAYAGMATSLLAISVYLPPPCNFFFADDWRYYTVMASSVTLLVAYGLRRPAAPLRRPRLRYVAAAAVTLVLVTPTVCALDGLQERARAWLEAPGEPFVIPRSPQRIAVEAEIGSQHPPRAVVFSFRPTDFLAEDAIVAYYPSCVRHPAKLHATAPTTVFVVLPTADALRTSADVGERLAGLAIIRRLHLSLRSTGVGFELYSGSIGPRR